MDNDDGGGGASANNAGIPQPFNDDDEEEESSSEPTTPICGGAGGKRMSRNLTRGDTFEASMDLEEEETSGFVHAPDYFENNLKSPGMVGFSR